MIAKILVRLYYKGQETRYFGEIHVWVLLKRMKFKKAYELWRLKRIYGIR